MSADSESHAAARERLSALADGELVESAVADVCAHWRDDVEVRATWHAYQVIGDVLRSDDLAATCAGDEEFLRTLRARLADEPTVMAPQVDHQRHVSTQLPASQARSAGGSRWGWLAPSAVAAGFVAVVGVVTVTRTPSEGSSAGLPVATVTPAPTTVAAVATAGSAALLTLGDSSVEPQVQVASGKFIRDVQLDRYLAAHKQFAGSSALGVPSGFLRSATTDTAGRGETR